MGARGGFFPGQRRSQIACGGLRKSIFGLYPLGHFQLPEFIVYWNLVQIWQIFPGALRAIRRPLLSRAQWGVFCPANPALR